MPNSRPDLPNGAGIFTYAFACPTTMTTTVTTTVTTPEKSTVIKDEASVKVEVLASSWLLWSNNGIFGIHSNEWSDQVLMLTGG
ncbi:hypothetical protein M422DRAFT_247428 [Sphaerobolus stellatus SS14]|nr:hypothetical protein M422DRAFT_247428 [Sphaerobolus stellatus SS14]